jgi:hypothetical protein
MTPAEAIEAAELAETEIRYRNQLVRDLAGHAAAAEYERGQVDGYLRAVADFKAFQRAEVADAELETRRWGPGGRAHFADPRPGDFPAGPSQNRKPNLSPNWRQDDHRKPAEP